MYKVYILLCKNNLFYTGFTDKLKRRLEQHQRSEVRFTSHLLPVKLVYYENHKSKEEAMKREK